MASSPSRYFVAVGCLHGIEQIVQNNIVAGELLQRIPQHGLGFGGVAPAVVRRFPAQLHDLFLLLHQIEVKQFVGGHLEESRNGGNERRVGHTGSSLPLAYRLKGYAQHLRQYLLRDILLLAERFDLFSHLDFHSHRSFTQSTGLL